MTGIRALGPHDGSIATFEPAELASAGFVRLTAIAAAIVGIGVLCGWAFDVTVLKSGLPHLHAAQPISAITLALSALALVCAVTTSKSLSLVTLGLAIVIALVAADALLTASFDLGLERFLFADKVEANAVAGQDPGRMSQATAVLFVLIASSVLLSRSQARGAQAGFVSVATVGLLLTTSVLVGFLFGMSPQYGAGENAHVSLPLALGQSLALIGVLCLRPDLGWMRLLAGGTPAAREMRSLAVGVIALPLALAIVLQVGLRSGLYDPEVRTALMVLGSIVVVFIALLMSAARLKRIDDERQRSLQAQQRIESDLSLALAAAKMVGFQCDLKTGEIRRFAGTGAQGRLVTEEYGNYENYLRRVHPEDRQRVTSYLKQQQGAHCNEYELQYRLQWPDGRITWVLDKGAIAYDEAQQPVEIAGIVLDITQTVQAREALKESELRFRRLAEAMPQIVYIAGPQGESQYVNQRWREYTGLSSANRTDYASRVPVEDYERLSGAWDAAVASGTSFTAEFRLRGADGLFRWFLTRAVPIRDAEGHITRWCGASTDIDAQKRAHEELRLVTDHADVYLAHCDADARYIFINRAYAVHLACAPEDILGKSMLEVLGEEAYARIEPYVQRTLTGEHVSFEVDAPHEQLGSRYMHCRCVPDLDTETGQVRGFVAAITDVSERHQLEEQLRQADHLKDEFLALLAHELRNPLAPIRYAIGLLKPGVPKEIAAAAHDVIERQVAHMARLVDDLLDVSRITRNTLELRPERLDLRAVVAAAVDVVRPLYEAVNHKLSVSLPSEPALIMGDVTRLSQIVGNLLNNAAKFTEPGGQIQVDVEREAAGFILRVRDTGVGIAPDLLPRLFDLFVQGDRTQTRASGGLGVGLSLAKRLVEMHGGSIEAHSEGPTQGSVFTVRLPAAVDTSAVEPRAVSENVLPIFQRKHQLLIVDDNLDAANSLAILTQMSGYVTHIANDGLAAIEMAEIVRPEAIIMDLGMPKMTGYEAARWVRQQPWGKDTILIAVTGWGQEDDRRKSREAGFDVHLTKPVDSADLLNELQQHGIAVPGTKEADSSERSG